MDGIDEPVRKRKHVIETIRELTTGMPGHQHPYSFETHVPNIAYAHNVYIKGPTFVHQLSA